PGEEGEEAGVELVVRRRGGEVQGLDLGEVGPSDGALALLQLDAHRALQRGVREGDDGVLGAGALVLLARRLGRRAGAGLGGGRGRRGRWGAGRGARGGGLGRVVAAGEGEAEGGEGDGERAAHAGETTRERRGRRWTRRSARPAGPQAVPPPADRLDDGGVLP